MANNLTDFSEVQLLKWLLNLTPTYTPGATKLALFTTLGSTPEAGTGLTEVTGGSYARQTITWTISGGQAQTSADITFPTATASWGTIVAAGVYDNGGTNLLGYGTLTTSRTIDIGEIFKVLSGSLSLSLD